tara:strand:+ start:367 stop:717 length:351 start_codon:yes stop_codon:yes gene_type:complete
MPLEATKRKVKEMIKVQEVCEKKIQTGKIERPDGSLFTGLSKVYEARSTLINPSYVVAVYPHEYTSSLDIDKLEKNFPADTKFCTLVLDGNSFRTSEIVVVGSFEKFCRRLEAPKL